jgi:DNA-binding LytR/AlgR family response regulator
VTIGEPRARPATAIIAEDEPVLRADLQARLAGLWPELKIAGSAENGIEALAMFERHHPAVVFLDVEMPGLDGVQVARQLSGQCHMVFITAYDVHAVAAFETGAIDYVLKPYDNARLALALRRVRDRLATLPASLDAVLEQLALHSRPKAYLRWIKASRGDQIDLITVGDVTHFQAEAKYTTVFTERREAIIRQSIKQLVEELDPNAFWQIHRSTIVNVEAIESINRSIGGMSVKLRGRPMRLPVSEPYRRLFRQL